MGRSRWLGLALVAELALIPAAAAQRPIVVRALVGRTGRVIADTMGTPFGVPFPAGRVFAALDSVFADLKIPVEVRDSARLQVGNEGFVRRGDVAGRRMSAYLDCGQGFTGPRADAYRIDIGLISFIAAEGPDTASLRSVLLGTAVNVTEGSRPTQPCYSTGELERRMHQMVLKRLTSIPEP